MIDSISILNYGVGNIYSLENAVRFLGFNSSVITSPEQVKESSKLILPGVGAFPHAMSKLRNDGLDEAVIEHAKQGLPLLGICLGMQLLFSESEEFGLSKGLNLINGRVKKFKNNEGFSVPQIQWNCLEKTNDCLLMKNINEDEMFYFLHSYYVETKTDDGFSYGITNYANTDYTSLVEYENIMGVQFHPEKSGPNGLQLIKNYIEEC